MGSTGSRTRLRKVAPCNSLQEEADQPVPQWTLPALPVTAGQPSGSLGQRKTMLSPLKQEIAISTSSGSLPRKQSNTSSIIHSHPPKRPQALQPLPPQIGHTGTANQIVMGRDCRDGDVHLLSTTGPTERCGTSRVIQGGHLEAQTALSQQTHQRRRAKLRQARETRRRKVVYTFNDPNKAGRIVRRPTERDIFWDETAGQYLDPSCFLDPKSLPPLCKERQHNHPNSVILCGREERIQRVQPQGETEQTGHWGWSTERESSWTAERKEECKEDSGTTQLFAREVQSPGPNRIWTEKTFLTNLKCFKK